MEFRPRTKFRLFTSKIRYFSFKRDTLTNQDIPIQKNYLSQIKNQRAYRLPCLKFQFLYGLILMIFALVFKRKRVRSF